MRAFRIASQWFSLASAFQVSLYNRRPNLSFLVLRESERDELMELYRTVAEQDPEWYQEFVCKVLQEDVLANEVESIDAINGENGENLKSVFKFDSFHSQTLPSPTTRYDKVDVNDINDKEQAGEYDHEDNELVHNLDSVENIDSDVKFDDDSKNDDVERTEEEGIVMVMSNGDVAVEEKNVVTNVSSTSFDAVNSQPTVVVYRDLYSGALLMAPLKALTRLGYTSDEIAFLQPDALSLILEDEIAKPRRGVPPQWKVSPSQKRVLEDDVRIVTKERAKEILESSKTRKPPLVEDDRAETRRKSVREEESLGGRRRIPTPGQDDEARQRVRRIQEREQSPSTKLRPSPSKDRGDPPRPVNPVWIDMDTFRDLLRKEAELRVRILGDDWKQTVKKESKWRLDLYKEWLWSLSEGVGDPVVTSRVPRSSASSRRGAPNADASSPGRQARVQRRDPGSERRVLDPRNKPSKRAKSTGKIRSAREELEDPRINEL